MCRLRDRKEFGICELLKSTCNRSFEDERKIVAGNSRLAQPDYAEFYKLCQGVYVLFQSKGKSLKGSEDSNIDLFSFLSFVF